MVGTQTGNKIVGTKLLMEDVPSHFSLFVMEGVPSIFSPDVEEHATAINEQPLLGKDFLSCKFSKCDRKIQFIKHDGL
jgi:hypothetical protein